MRWIPLLVIWFLSLSSGTYIHNSIEDFNSRIIAMVSLFYMTFLGTILFTPLAFDGLNIYIMPAGIGRVNLYHIFVDIGFVENIILTMPLGFLIKRFYSRTSLLAMIPIGLMTGATIETMQYYLSHVFWINRTSDISDVVSNGIGIVIGASIALAYHYIYDKKYQIIT
ncbi:VanZ family protein [Companilactobacillus hulinensis]|uniref:VanZ family protein n=1 Tax=Companilactobacillus hulinensis TaxID=2486007 RepID=UPI000F7ACBEF|nr:VanZ family protein [Companilactobacillus hulinensis]